MKNILGHRSWNEQEILEFFDKGHFTMCRLPHYRYANVQRICGLLAACGLIEKCGGTETGVNYAPKPEYHQWRQDVREGKAPASLRRLLKAQKPPPKLLKHRCKQCRGEYETYNHAQRFCSKQCKAEASPYRARLRGEAA